MIIICSKHGKSIKIGVVRRRNRIIFHSKQEKKYKKRETKGRGGFY
jgi:hypothetical protein